MAEKSAAAATLIEQLELMLDAVEALKPRLERATDILLRAGHVIDV